MYVCERVGMPSSDKGILHTLRAMCPGVSGWYSTDSRGVWVCQGWISGAVQTPDYDPVSSLSGKRVVPLKHSEEPLLCSTSVWQMTPVMTPKETV